MHKVHETNVGKIEAKNINLSNETPRDEGKGASISGLLPATPTFTTMKWGPVPNAHLGGNILPRRRPFQAGGASMAS